MPASLETRFTLASETVDVGAHRVRIERPESAEALISEEDFERDERLPYWADLWPSARVLATMVAARGHPAGRALELGCGLGLVSIAAMLVGHEVTATDYYADALLFTERNAIGATGRSPATRLVDWRALPVDLGHFDLVLAADVLYERPYAAMVAAAIERTLAPAGRAWVADQGRVALGSFLEASAARGLGHRVIHSVAPAAGTAAPTITVYELTFARRVHA